MRRLTRLGRDEAGMSMVFVGLGLMAFLSASMLAIDVGMLMTARSQAQNSADAGALAGAVALFYDDYDDRTPTGPAVTSAINGATANQVMAADVSVTPDDVEFLNDEAGDPNRIRVTVRRTAERGNPVSTLIAQFFGMTAADIAATATAELSPANAMTCVKPFTIPDKWIEMQTPPWDGTDTYEAYYTSGPLKGQKRPDADIYIPAVDANGNPNPDYTGYNMQSNRGQRLVIRAHHGNNINASFYFSIAIGGETGGSDYRWNIANCNQHIMHYGELLLQEPGAMSGPTAQGIQELIDRDPGAYWDHTTNRVAGSSYDGQSPRVFPIPLYDPEFFDSGKREGRMADLKVANWIGFFAEEVASEGIIGRIIPIGGIRDRTVENGATNLFPKAIRLVQ
jgi:Flp pilus assembly protein TadG